MGRRLADLFRGVFTRVVTRRHRPTRLHCEALERRDVPAYLPYAPDITASTTAGTPASVVVMAYDMDGDVLTLTPGQPAHGVVTGSGTTFTYTPGAGFLGTDVFTYTAPPSARSG